MPPAVNPDPSPAASGEFSIPELHRQVCDHTHQGIQPVVIGRSQFPVYPQDPLAEYHHNLDEYFAQVRADTNSWRTQPQNYPASKIILQATPGQKLAYLRAIAVRILFHKSMGEKPQDILEEKFQELYVLMKQLPKYLGFINNPGANYLISPSTFDTLTSELFRSELAYTESDISVFIDIASREFINPYFFNYLSPDSVLRAVERHTARHGLSSHLQEKLAAWQARLQDDSRATSKHRKLITRLSGLLGPGTNPGVQPGEAWSNACLEDLQAMPAAQTGHWCRLLQHCQTAESSQPTKKWLAAALSFLETVGRDEFKRLVINWFELVALPRPEHCLPQSHYHPDPDQLICGVNAVTLKGLVWLCADWQDQSLTRSLSRLAQVCFKKVVKLGPRCPLVGNACFYALSHTPTEDAAAELTRLNHVVKQPSARKLLNKSLNKAAELTGQTREDLEESTVPAYGINVHGCIVHKFGDCTATYSIYGKDAFVVTWKPAGGKAQKSIPPEVKTFHAADLKAFKRTLQDIQRMLPAQRHRLERLFLANRVWPLDKWQVRYLDHPLLAHLSRPLIWHFQQDTRSASGIWHKGQLVDAQDRPLDWLTPQTSVRLWHPLDQPVDSVMHWRRWLESHEVTQPFKQAHREIYILTDAELNTATYSNRFAAHIIRQHQFAALARERGWTYQLQGNFDSHNIPSLSLPQWELTVEFWANPPEANTDVASSGIYLHLTTDQVRFCRSLGEALPLNEVPALVFSEVMRDVDLFVGVCSLGNDPTWQDQGLQNPFGAYWRQYSFGDLSASAKIRHEVLHRLLPRLKIAAQCNLEDKFLVVRGQLRTYKIHLGSSNILMEPNNEYLCIVPDSKQLSASTGSNVFLPFEGDRTLSVILSKAFLLADDSKIKDPSILNQISA